MQPCHASFMLRVSGPHRIAACPESRNRQSAAGGRSLPAVAPQPRPSSDPSPRGGGEAPPVPPAREGRSLLCCCLGPGDVVTDLRHKVPLRMREAPSAMRCTRQSGHRAPTGKPPGHDAPREGCTPKPPPLTPPHEGEGKCPQSRRPAKAARCFVAASAPEMPSPTFGTGWHCGCATSRTHASRRTKGPPRCKGKGPSPAVLRKPPAASSLDMPSWTSGTSQPYGRETTRAPCATPGEGAAGQRGKPA